MDTHRLRMATQFGGDLVGRLADPAQKDHLGVTFPISGRVMAPGQLAHQAFFLLILRRSRFHLLGHLSVPPFGLFSSLYFSTIEERSNIWSYMLVGSRDAHMRSQERSWLAMPSSGQRSPSLRFWEMLKSTGSCATGSGWPCIPG